MGLGGQCTCIFVDKRNDHDAIDTWTIEVRFDFRGRSASEAIWNPLEGRDRRTVEVEVCAEVKPIDDNTCIFLKIHFELFMK